MTTWQPHQRKEYWRIATHSVITFMGQSAMQIVDLLFCRSLGSQASATVGTAWSLFAWFMIVGIGLISSLEYLIPHAIGSGEDENAHSYYYMGIVVGSIVSLGSTLCLIGLAYFSPHLGINPALVDPVRFFCTTIAISYFPVFLIPVFRIELQSRGHSHDTTLAFLYGNLLNIFLNWMLVLGHLGFPAYGIKGSAFSNVISRFGILFYIWGRAYWVRRKLSIPTLIKKIPSLKYAKEILKMGAPTSLHMLFEMGAFVLVSTLAARLISSHNAAHTIALNLASFAFMVPLGLGSAASLTMSKAKGEEDPKLAVFLGKHTIRLGMMYAAITSAIFILTRHLLISFYTDDPDTIAIGASLMLIVAIFQFGDSMQVILAGCLRGFGETRFQAVANGIGHWMIGVPLGITLAFYYHLDILGLWIGLCVGLFSVAIALGLKWRKMSCTFEAE